jgi:hypothetical protein
MRRFFGTSSGLLSINSLKLGGYQGIKVPTMTVSTTFSKKESILSIVSNGTSDNYMTDLNILKIETNEIKPIAKYRFWDAFNVRHLLSDDYQTLELTNRIRPSNSLDKMIFRLNDPLTGLPPCIERTVLKSDTPEWAKVSPFTLDYMMFYIMKRYDDNPHIAESFVCSTSRYSDHEMIACHRVDGEENVLLIIGANIMKPDDPAKRVMFTLQNSKPIVNDGILIHNSFNWKLGHCISEGCIILKFEGNNFELVKFKLDDKGETQVSEAVNLMMTLKETNGVRTLSGNTLAISNSEDKAEFFDITTGELIYTFEDDGKILNIRALDSETKFAILTVNGLNVIDLVM